MPRPSPASQFISRTANFKSFTNINKKNHPRASPKLNKYYNKKRTNARPRKTLQDAKM